MTTLQLKQPKLPDSLRQLANRVAVERTRNATWSEGQRLRAFCRERMAEGASVVEVTGWLARELESALAQQSSR